MQTNQNNDQSHPVSILSLQTELKSLCVSSPPSLQTSPIHQPISQSSTPPSSTQSPSALSSMLQQNVLQIISEENISSSNQKTGDFESHSPVSLPNSPLAFLDFTFTPPQSFRSSLTSSPNQNENAQSQFQSQSFESGVGHLKFNQIAPSISVTDESGCSAQFPIIPPPLDFSHNFSNEFSKKFQLLEETNLKLNQNKEDSNREMQSLGLFKLHRWKDGNKKMCCLSLI